MGGCLTEEKKSKNTDQSTVNIQISNSTSNPNKSQLQTLPQNYTA